MVPARLAEKMSVMSVGTSPFSAHRTIAAERVHRPGSRRLGGVEATGASPGVAPSRPHARVDSSLSWAFCASRSSRWRFIQVRSTLKRTSYVCNTYSGVAQFFRVGF